MTPDPPVGDRRWPYIDPRVKYVGISKLRQFNAEALRAMTDTFVLQDVNDTPIAVLLPYATFITIQEAIHEPA